MESKEKVFGARGAKYQPALRSWISEGLLFLRSNVVLEAVWVPFFNSKGSGPIPLVIF
jgi:hypothetical protein